MNAGEVTALGTFIITRNLAIMHAAYREERVRSLSNFPARLPACGVTLNQPTHEIRLV